MVGGPIPEGPVLVTANHLNALLDPLIIFHVAGRPTSPLAKAPLFDQLVVGTMLRVLGGLPVYRRQDDPTLMDRNEDTFRGAIAALHRGAAIQIFPEGKSHSEPALEPLRTGAARIALRAEAEADGALGLQIVPVGLTYEGKQFFRSRVIAEIGEPFPVGPWLPAYREHEVEAVRGLTDEIAARLRDVTLNLERPEDRPLLEAAARMYTREKRLHGWREREGLVEHIPRLRRMAVRLEWLRDSDPERYDRRGVGAAHRGPGLSGGLVALGMDRCPRRGDRHAGGGAGRALLRTRCCSLGSSVDPASENACRSVGRSWSASSIGSSKRRTAPPRSSDLHRDPNVAGAVFHIFAASDVRWPPRSITVATC